MSYEDFDAVLDVHLRGAFHVVRPAFPLMCDAGYGRIVLTSSIGGLYGNHGVANYAVAKAGVIGLVNVAALEGAEHGVTCNAIVPGAVTRMAEGLDTSAYPPMGPGPGRAGRRLAVARIVPGHRRDVRSRSRAGSPAPSLPRHPGCTGRRGLWRTWPKTAMPSATTSDPVVFPVVPTGHADHIGYSFGMATQPVDHG